MRKRNVNLKTEKIKSSLVGYASMGILSLLMLAFIFPSINTANAEGEPLNNTSSLKTSTYVYSTLAVSLSDNVNLEITPKSNGSFVSGSTTLKVTTNNTTGYAVFMQTEDNTSILKPANGMIDSEIGPVVGEMTSASYQNNLNTWGYAIASGAVNADALSYKAVPKDNDGAIATSDQLAAEDSYTIGFAAAVSADLPAGNYYNSVLVSVVANPIAVHTLSGITYMQEMSPYVCDYSDENETKQLIDTRDGKSYWVAKLKDGNCWMTQNLALDLDVNEAGNAVAVNDNGDKVELDKTNTDINTPWKGATRTENGVPIFGAYDNNGTRSWKLGKIILAKLTDLEICPEAKVPDNSDYYSGPDEYSSVYYDQNLAENCPAYFKNVRGMADGFVATNDVSYGDNSYDAHYLIGNYYQYGAVTAGTGLGIVGTSATDANGTGLTNADGSICPKGWQLPKAGVNEVKNSPTYDYAFDINGSFYKLLSQYGYQNNNPFSISVRSLVYSPTYILPSGFIESGRGQLRHAAAFAMYRSGTIIPGVTDRAYTLYADLGSTWPTNAGDNYYAGFSVRCVNR